MSLDVALAVRGDPAADLARVAAECESLPHYTVHAGDDATWRITYHDPDTGTRWRVDRDDRGGLRAIIDYVRPTCFAEQAIDELVALAGSLDLVPMLDGAAADRVALRTAWAAGNLGAVRALAAVTGQSVPHLAPAAARAWWEYTRHRESLARVLGEDVFVPNVALVREPESDAVQRLMSWPDAIPCVLPPCDHVVLLRSRSGGAAPFTARLARRDPVVAALADLLVAAPAAVGGLRMLPPERAEAAAERLRGVPSRPMRRFASVEPDGFVDVR